LSVANVLNQVSTIFQILFFFATGCVAILSYVTAKRTLFQPLRTEIFKKQIEDMGLVLKMFSGKGEVELREDFAFPALIIANIAIMYDDYGQFAFDWTRPEDLREYRHELCPQIMARLEALEPATGYLIDDAPKEVAKPKQWKYEGYVIPLPRAFPAKQDEFMLILDNPVLPTTIVAMLEEYLNVILGNVDLVRDVIVKCAEEMPSKYPELNDLKKASYDWIRNRINSEFHELEPESKKINAYVRTYFGPDNLLPSKRQSNRMLGRAQRLIGQVEEKSDG